MTNPGGNRELTLPEGAAGQTVAVTAAIALLAALWLAVVSPILTWYAGQSDDLANAKLEVAHLRAVRASLPQLRQRIADQAADAPQTAVLLQGDSDAIAAANLQTVLNNLATQAGASLDSTEVVAAESTGGLRRIGVSVTLNATWPVLVAFLTAIETATPRMIADDLTVSTDAPPDTRTDVVLQASFTVAAFRAGTAP